LAFADQSARQDRYRRLNRRNRFVGILRLALPALGLIVLAGLIVQITISSLSARYGLGQVEVEGDRVRVRAPEYAGSMTDGSVYRIWAEEAFAAIADTDRITLVNVRAQIETPAGLRREASALSAQLDAESRQVHIPGVTEIADSTGTTGQLVDTDFDWPSQILTTRGAVEIDYSDGSSVRAKGLVHDAEQGLWTFHDAVVTLPATPGEPE
jgi:lipopolysaccharide export system protein LptC